MLRLQATKETISYLKSLICNPFFSLYGQKWTFKVKARTFGLYSVYTKTIIDLSVDESGGYLTSILQLGKYPPLLSFQLQTLSSSYQLFFLVTLCGRAWPHLLWSWKKAPNIALLVIDHLISICTFMEWLLTIPLHFSEYIRVM